MPPTEATDIVLPIQDSVVALEAILEEHRGAFRKSVSISVSTLEGNSFVIDSDAPRMVTPGWREQVDVQLLTNDLTLSDWLTGRFDPRVPDDHHVFLWSGDTTAWENLGAAIAETQTSFSAHLDSVKKTK